MIRYTYDARGQMVAIYEDGTVVPVLGADNAGVAQGTSGTGQAAPQTGTDANGYAGDTGYAQNRGYAREYSRTYTPRSPEPEYPTYPAYADGSRHPLQGGDPRVAGGLFAEQSDGGRGQQQVYVPEGAAAGPYSTRAAYPAGGGGGGGQGAKGGGGGGGGGGASPAYYKLKAKLTGGGSSSSSYGNERAYKPPKEKEEKMRGKYARGLDPDQAYGLASRPTALLDVAVPGMSQGSPLRDHLANLPAYQLAILGKRNYKGRPRDIANSIGTFYEKAGTTGDLPDFETVFRNLTNPKKGGGIDQMFSGVKNSKRMQKATGYEYEYGREPLAAADAGAAFENLLGGALSLLPAATEAKYLSGASRLIDEAVLKNMKKKPGKGKSIQKYVGRRLFK